MSDDSTNSGYESFGEQIQKENLLDHFDKTFANISAVSVDLAAGISGIIARVSTNPADPSTVPISRSDNQEVPQLIAKRTSFDY